MNRDTIMLSGMPLCARAGRYRKYSLCDSSTAVMESAPAAGLPAGFRARLSHVDIFITPGNTAFDGPCSHEHPGMQVLIQQSTSGAHEMSSGFRAGQNTSTPFIGGTSMKTATGSVACRPAFLRIFCTRFTISLAVPISCE